MNVLSILKTRGYKQKRFTNKLHNKYNILTQLFIHELNLTVRENNKYYPSSTSLFTNSFR